MVGKCSANNPSHHATASLRGVSTALVGSGISESAGLSPLLEAEVKAKVDASEGDGRDHSVWILGKLPLFLAKIAGILRSKG